MPIYELPTQLLITNLPPPSCPMEYFQCDSTGPLPHCISWSKHCDGEIDCDDGSDEDSCDSAGGSMSLSGGALTGLILAALLMFIIIGVQIAIRIYRLRLQSHQNRAYRNRMRRIAEIAAENRNDIEAPSNTSYDPPSYWQCLDNPSYIPDGNERVGKQREEKPPSYDTFLKGDFVEYQMPSTTAGYLSELSPPQRIMPKAKPVAEISESNDSRVTRTNEIDETSTQELPILLAVTEYQPEPATSSMQHMSSNDPTAERLASSS